MLAAPAMTPLLSDPLENLQLASKQLHTVWRL